MQFCSVHTTEVQRTAATAIDLQQIVNNQNASLSTKTTAEVNLLSRIYS